MGDVIDDGALESIWQYCGCASNGKKGTLIIQHPVFIQQCQNEVFLKR